MYADSPLLADVEFLVSSPNRLDVFEALWQSPRPRHELQELTDASRVTLSRILRDLEAHGWIERTAGTYATTPKGAVVAAETEQLFANLAAIDTLEPVLGWLPVALFDFNLSALTDATILSSTKRNLTAAITHTATRVREATIVRNIATGISSEVIDAYLEGATHRDRSLETVLHASVFDSINDDATLQAQLRAMLEADRITVRRVDGEEPPIMLTLCDDSVIMCGRSDQRSPPEGLETSNADVRAWARSYFEELHADSTLLTADLFTP